MSTRCLFVSDLHGSLERYAALWRAVERERPAALFLGGDLLPGRLRAAHAPGENFLEEVVAAGLDRLRERLGDGYPRVFVILGNDDGRVDEPHCLELERRGLIAYLNERKSPIGRATVYGYAYVPPTPFRLKDWERYDVSRYVDPGCLSPEEGERSVPVDARETRRRTIAADLDALVGDDDLTHAVFLFHAPPHRTTLDRAALDGRRVDHAPVDVHVGSIAVRRFIEARQPALTLHGHIHESARLTGAWSDRIGRTVLLGAAHDGDELALVRFDLERPEAAERELL